MCLLCRSSASVHWLGVWLWRRWIQSNWQNTTCAEACTSITSCCKRYSRYCTDEYHRVCFENISLFQDCCKISSRSLRWHCTVAYCTDVRAFKCRLSRVHEELLYVCISCPEPVFLPVCHCHCICVGQVCMFVSHSSYNQYLYFFHPRTIA